MIGFRPAPVPPRAAIALLATAILGLAWLAAVAPAPARAQPAGPGEEAAAASRGRVTGLPIPRFVSLKSAKVNLRRGPDTRYPIDRVLRRRALPVRVVDEYESWREVEVPADPLVTGTRRGWIHGALLESRDRVMIRDGVTTLRESPIREARPRARAEPGVIAELESCREGWCRIAILGETYEGWVPRHRLWGVAFAPGL